jgi:hypothetical protein
MFEAHIDLTDEPMRQPDKLGECVERNGDAKRSWRVDPEFLVAAQVLQEPQPGDDHDCGPVAP